MKLGTLLMIGLTSLKLLVYLLNLKTHILSSLANPLLDTYLKNSSISAQETSFALFFAALFAIPKIVSRLIIHQMGISKPFL